MTEQKVIVKQLLSIENLGNPHRDTSVRSCLGVMARHP